MFRWVAAGVLVTALILILRPASPPTVAIDPEAPRRLEGKLQRLHAAGPSGTGRSLRLDEAEVNGWIQSNLATAVRNAARPGDGSPRPVAAIDVSAPTDLSPEQVQSNVRDVKVHLAGDQVTAYVLFNLYGKDLSLTLEGRLSAHEGYLRLSPTRMQLGSLPIPQATVERAVHSLLDSPGNREQFRLPPEVRELRVENGDLVVTLR